MPTVQTGLRGHSIIAGADVHGNGGSTTGFNPAKNQPLDPPYSLVDAVQLASATHSAEDAFASFSTLDPERHAHFLERIAENIEAAGPELIEGAMAETGLPEARLTGDRGRTTGQLRLMAAAVARPEPIPVYAEMSSINPVLIFHGALTDDVDALAAAYVASVTGSAGQLCTAPGLVFVPEGAAGTRFANAVGRVLAGTAGQTMLTCGIAASWHAGAGEPLAAVNRLEGQLTVTLHLAEADHLVVAPLLSVLERKAGRILVNGWPTGVEVGPATVHGGPFPAASDTRTTPVGTLAIDRFLRPVAYQNLPDTLLPLPLRRENPWTLNHLIDGTIEHPGGTA